MKQFTKYDFIYESNHIEGIDRLITDAEVEEFDRFMELPAIDISDMQQFVRVYQPGAVLRERPGMNVRVGNHVPPEGGIEIKTRLMDLLQDASRRCGVVERTWAESAYEIHQRYETLHPFMDGNGRSGRMLWMWMMQKAPLGFLHTWYYQSLQFEGKRT